MNMTKLNNTNVLFSGHDFKFLIPLVEYCEDKAIYNVELQHTKGHYLDSEQDAAKLLDWADVIFCEWAMGQAEWYSKYKKKNQKLIIRLHLQEIENKDKIPFIYNICWANVDSLILICQKTYKWMINEFSELDGKAVLIYNPIDARGLLNVPKFSNSEYNIGFVGMIPQRKRVDLAIEIFKKLKEKDSRYVLHIKGKQPEEYSWMINRKEELEWYSEVYRKIEDSPFSDSIVFDPYGNNMQEWYSRMGFIFSTSDFEGSHQAVAEGMASGCIPIIRDWEGATDIYPQKYSFHDTDEAIEKILAFNTVQNYQSEADSCRYFAQNNFDNRDIVKKLESLWRDDVKYNSLQNSINRNGDQNIMFLGYIPVGYEGGYKIRIEQEIRVLTKKGVNILFSCFYPQDKTDGLKKHKKELESWGCKVELIPTTSFFDIDIDEQRIENELIHLKSIILESAIGIVHSEALYSTRIAVLLKRQCPGIKIVFDCHGVSPEEEKMVNARESRIKMLENWERIVLNEVDLSLFVSNAMHSHYLDKYKIEEINHTIIPCCVTEERFPNHDDKPKVLMDKEKLIIAYLGTMSAWQCGDEMMRLFSELSELSNNLHFLIIVPQSDHFKVSELIEKYKISLSSVTLCELKHHEVAASLQQADIALMLRRKDPVNIVSSPTKFGEYLAAGVPVVLTDSIGDFSDEVIGTGIGLRIDSSLLDLSEFPMSELHKILDFANKVKYWRQKKERCQLFPREKLNWNVEANEIVDAYMLLSKKEQV